MLVAQVYHARTRAMLARSGSFRRLGKKDRAFARAVLRGESWREMGLAKSTFSDRMKKVEKLLSRP